MASTSTRAAAASRAGGNHYGCGLRYWPAVAIAFARGGADILISYPQEHDDAKQTQHWVEQAGRRAILMPGDVADETYCPSCR